MENTKDLILKAIDYVNDFPARVDEFLTKEKFREQVGINAKYYIGCDPIEEKLKSDFKIGDWVIRTLGKNSLNHELGRVFKIAKLDQITDSDGITHFSSSLRHATNKEIEEHLIAEAVKKGLVAYRFFKWENEHISQILPQNGFTYVDREDALVVGVSETTQRRAIYHNGEWAIPVWDTPKKKLPKTKAEFNTFLGHWNSRHTPTTKAFLDDYED